MREPSILRVANYLGLPRTLARLSGEFDELSRAIGAPDFGRIEELFTELGSIIADDDAVQSFDARPPEEATRALVKTIQAQAASLSMALELDQAAQAARDISRTNRYLMGVSRSALFEIDLAGIRPDSRILSVGAGPFPMTAITMARRHGTHVLCLDLAERAVEASRALVRALELDGRIAMRLGRAEDTDLAGFSHVHIASLVPQKEPLLKALRSRLASGTIVIARYGNGLKSLFNYELEGPGDGWTVLDHKTTPGGLYDVVFLQA